MIGDNDKTGHKGTRGTELSEYNRKHRNLIAGSNRRKLNFRCRKKERGIRGELSMRNSHVETQERLNTKTRRPKHEIICNLKTSGNY